MDKNRGVFEEEKQRQIIYMDLQNYTSQCEPCMNYTTIACKQKGYKRRQVVPNVPSLAVPSICSAVAATRELIWHLNA